MGALCPRAKPSSCRVAPDAARFIVRGDADVAAIAGATFGVELSLDALPRQKFGGSRRVVARARRMVVDRRGRSNHTPLAAALAAALAPRAHSLVDISQRQIGLELEGALAARTLNAGCPLDLREVAFPVGMATRTMIAKAEAVVWRRAQERFHVEIWTFVRRLRGDIPCRGCVAGSRMISVCARPAAT